MWNNKFSTSNISKGIIKVYYFSWLDEEKTMKKRQYLIWSLETTLKRKNSPQSNKYHKLDMNPKLQFYSEISDKKNKSHQSGT